MTWKDYIFYMSSIEKYVKDGKNFNQIFSTVRSDWEFLSSNNIKVIVYDETFIIPISKILGEGVSASDLISKTKEFLQAIHSKYRLNKEDLVEFTIKPEYVNIVYKDINGNKKSASIGYDFINLYKELALDVKLNPYKVMDFNLEETSYLYSKAEYEDYKFSLIEKELLYCGFNLEASLEDDKSGVHLLYIHPIAGVCYLYKRPSGDTCTGIYCLETSKGLFTFDRIIRNWDGNGSIFYSKVHSGVSRELNKGYVYCGSEFIKGLHNGNSYEILISHIQGASYEDSLSIFKKLISNISDKYIDKYRFFL